MTILIDTTFDFQSEIGAGRDPDRYSPTLRKYHNKLWNKCLPNGELFELEDTHPKGYLYHQSSLGEYQLTSDAITHSYKNTKRMSHIINEIPTEKTEEIFSQGSTIGSYILFPKNKVKNQHSINQARGCNHKIVDRFDLTLECIRLFYNDLESPLTSVFQRHADFFYLFVNFKGYVDFFLLQDLVASDYSSIKYHLAHQGFETKPLPQDVDEYLEYRQNTLNFIAARNKRILNSVDGKSGE